MTFLLYRYLVLWARYSPVQHPTLKWSSDLQDQQPPCVVASGITCAARHLTTATVSVWPHRKNHQTKKTPKTKLNMVLSTEGKSPRWIPHRWVDLNFGQCVFSEEGLVFFFPLKESFMPLRCNRMEYRTPFLLVLLWLWSKLQAQQWARMVLHILN